MPRRSLLLAMVAGGVFVFLRRRSLVEPEPFDDGLEEVRPKADLAWRRRYSPGRRRG